MSDRIVLHRGAAQAVLDIRSSPWHWLPVSQHSDCDRRLAVDANLQSIDCQYSPADGEPGYSLAMHVARELAADVTLPLMPPAIEGVVY